ncbi:hypothetical protein [Paraburkholderia bryophila]|uniref:Uncharacterized protein n=1 Tax=Paraburkholderia bryophila TaxID=420952 RepID=A0A7Z0B5S6_9BURK|nr:hypothetical protein [Paraburkholderia bryophila]NYH21393.1 hypothetical protein [Paraburkholderia bryophila]
MSITKTLAGAMPFAHLLSNGKRAARAEQDERDQREDESDEDYAKRMEDLDEKDRAEEEKEKEDARRAAEEKEKEEARRAGAEDDDGDDESDGAKKAARATERTRCACIIAHGINIGAAAQAGVFAFDTKMSSKAAIAALDAANAAGGSRRSSLDDRMSRTTTPNPGSGSASGSAPTMAQQIVMANKKRLGEA